VFTRLVLGILLTGFLAPNTDLGEVEELEALPLGLDHPS